MDKPGQCRTCRGRGDKTIKRRSDWRWVYKDPRWAKLRDRVLSEEPLCAEPGCESTPTVVDHEIPHRGDEQLAFDRGNCRAMCKPHHDAKTGREVDWSGRAVPVTLVIGPPCAGKTSYVSEHAQPGDLIVDTDALAQALGSPAAHGHDDALITFVIEARDAILARLRRGGQVRHAWIVTTRHDMALPGAHVVTLDTSATECHRRARAAGRPAQWHDLIDTWWITHRAREAVTQSDWYGVEITGSKP